MGFGFGTGCPGLHLIGPIVWFNKGDEPRCAGCETQSEIADSDDGHDCDGCNAMPPAPANCVVRLKLQAPANSAPNCSDGPLVITSDGAGNIIFNRGGTHPLQIHGDAVFINEPLPCSQSTANCHAAQSATGSSSCTDGCPGLVAGQDTTLASPAAPCCCEEAEDAPQAPAAEPPAFLTLSQHKDSSASLPAVPHWQEELLKAFRGRRLSELFEPQAGQTPAGHELWRLLAEFPKHAAGQSADHSGAHSLTIVDLPDRVRIFESSGSAADPGNLSGVWKSSTTNACPSCREQFRAFLEEMFRGCDPSEEISQASHHEGGSTATETARDLPNVTHSKIETETRSYPLRDLVLCDDSGRPVFDTCSIIDHLQLAVAPESWSHPSVSMRLDQQSVSLVVTQTAEVHQKIADHLRYLRRLQVKQICNLIERMSGDDPGTSAQNDTVTPAADVELGPALPVGSK